MGRARRLIRNDPLSDKDIVWDDESDPTGVSWTASSAPVSGTYTYTVSGVSSTYQLTPNQNVVYYVAAGSDDTPQGHKTLAEKVKSAPCPQSVYDDLYPAVQEAYKSELKKFLKEADALCVAAQPEDLLPDDVPCEDAHVFHWSEKALEITSDPDNPPVLKIY